MSKFIAIKLYNKNNLHGVTVTVLQLTNIS